MARLIKGHFFVTYASGRQEKIFPKNKPHKEKVKKDLEVAKDMGSVKNYQFKGGK